MYISPIMITDKILCTVDSTGTYYETDIWFFTSPEPESKVSFCDRKVLSIHPSICHKLFTFSTSYSELLHAQS